MDGTTVATLIMSVILERPTCLLCIAAKANVSTLEAVRALERIGATVRIVMDEGGRCRACGDTLGPVYSVERPADPRPARPGA